MLRFGQKWWLTGLLALMLAGCQQTATPDTGLVSPPPEATPQQKQLAKSLETWQALKAENSDYYRYNTLFVSWTGFRSTTTLTVQGNEVVTRAYEASYTNDEGEEITESWTEESAAVGSHEAGAEPRTIEELYLECREDVLTEDTAENEFYLEFRNEGVLSSCYYRPLNCQDDCLFGVGIDDLDFPPFKNN